MDTDRKINLIETDSLRYSCIILNKGRYQYLSGHKRNGLNTKWVKFFQPHHASTGIEKLLMPNKLRMYLDS